MTAMIATIGLENRCASQLNSRFRAPQYEMLHISANAPAIDHILGKSPRLIIIGPMGRSFEDRLRLVRRIKNNDRQLPVILLNEKSGEARAIAALKAGADDYYNLPLSYPAFLKALESTLLIENGAAFPERMPSPGHDVAGVIGHGPVMAQIKRYLVRAAHTDSTVLITGETGTGKELIAETIHKNSSRAKRSMTSVNCAAIPDNLVESELFGFQKGAFTGALASQKGKLALANHGTLFLDEIGEMSLYAQAKILRSIENNIIFPLGAQHGTPLDVRIIAATNRNPEDLVEQGKFRRDLYYRLNVAHIHLPPLRERKEDIPDLVALGIDQLNRSMRRNIKTVSNEAMAALVQYAWPGNVRELKHMLESAFIQCDAKRIEFADFPQGFVKKLNYCADSRKSEKERLVLALTETRWNKTHAARKLKWSRMRIYRSLKRYDISPPKIHG